MPNVQDTKSHTMQRAGEPDADKLENLARLKKPLPVATHLKFHRSAASLGSRRVSPQQQTPPAEGSDDASPWRAQVAP